jgi:hypothetical protein
MLFYSTVEMKCPTINLSLTAIRVGFTVVYMEWRHSVALLKAFFHYNQYVVNMIKAIQIKDDKRGGGCVACMAKLNYSYKILVAKHLGGDRKR